MGFCLTTPTIAPFRAPSASLSLHVGSTTTTSVSLCLKSNRPIILHSSFTPPLSFTSAFSSFAGLSLGLDLNSGVGTVGVKRRGLVVRATKYSLCQTKRNRSRKSLARTHGFRKRMSTTRGKAVISHRRAKGRWVLCTKSNPTSGGKRV